MDPSRHFVYLDRGLQCAVPVADVLEIVETAALRPTHLELPACLGTVAHRDRLVPVLDSAVLVGAGGSRPPGPLVVVILRRDERFLGLTLERFVTVAALPPSPPVGHGEGFVAFVHAFRESALVVLATDRLAEAIAAGVGDQRIVRGEEDEGRDAGPARADAARLDVLCVSLEGLVLGLPVEDVVEVVEDCGVTPLFAVDPMLRGLIHLRGEVLACVDISAGLGFEPRALHERSQFVVLRSGGREAALCVDRVHRIRALPVAGMQEASSVLGEPMARFAASVVETGEDTVFLLSARRILEAPELQAAASVEP